MHASKLTPLLLTTALGATLLCSAAAPARAATSPTMGQAAAAALGHVAIAADEDGPKRVKRSKKSKGKKSLKNKRGKRGKRRGTKGTAGGPAQAHLEFPFQCELVDGLLCVHDTNSDLDVIAPNLHPFWKGPSNAIEPSVETTLTTNGLDVTYTFVNNTNQARPLGQVAIGGIRFGEDIESRMIELDTKELGISHGGSNYFGGGQDYPGRLYAPVAVLREGDYTVGVSLQYKMIDYQHSVFVRVESPGGSYTHGGRNWQVLYKLNDPERDFYNPEGDIQPGETREYTMSVRVMKGASDEWVRTLVPYRDFFQAEYGGVQYERDPRPVSAMSIAQTGRLSFGNQRGYIHPQKRPDEHGWGPWVETMNQRVDQDNYQRIMLMVPTGLHRVARITNYPFQFTSSWNDVPAMAESLDILAGFGAQPDSEFGMWWGRSGQVQSQWDSYDWELLDPDNPEHVALCMQEMAGAASVNTDCIGLDAISKLPAWECYRWVQRLKEEYPQMKFVIEAMAEDVTHTLGPTYVWTTRALGEEKYEAQNPFYLADFLLPGHETWGRVDGGMIKQKHSLPQNASPPYEIMERYIVEAAALGYVPVIHGRCPIPEGLVAAETWLETVPEDIRLPQGD